VRARAAWAALGSVIVMFCGIDDHLPAVGIPIDEAVLGIQAKVGLLSTSEAILIEDGPIGIDSSASNGGHSVSHLILSEGAFCDALVRYFLAGTKHRDAWVINGNGEIKIWANWMTQGCGARNNHQFIGWGGTSVADFKVMGEPLIRAILVFDVAGFDEDVSPQLPLRRIFGKDALLFASVPQPISGNPQLVGGLPKTPGKQGNESSENGGYKPIVNVKKFGELSYRDKSDFVAGALLLLGMVALLITLITGGDKKNESSKKHRPDN